MYVCLLNTVATDALMLKHQAISTHRGEWVIKFQVETPHISP